MARPPRPEPPPSKRVKIATIAFALILAAPAIFAAFVVSGRGSVAPATDDEVTATRTNGDLVHAKHLKDGWSLFTLDPESGIERQITHGYRDYGADWSPDGTRIV